MKFDQHVFDSASGMCALAAVKRSATRGAQVRHVEVIVLYDERARSARMRDACDVRNP